MVDKMNVRELKKQIVEVLKESDCQPVDISVIIMDALGIDKTALLTGNRDVSAVEVKKVMEMAERLKAGEPVQYITGKCEFMSLMFDIREGVLIPRADTETLIEAVMEKLPKDIPVSLIDMCCGSGCIGISLAFYMKNIRLSMCDVSDTATEVSAENAKKHIGDREYKIFNIDLLNDFPGEEYDCVVSNPPYIRREVIEGLDKNVRDYEPRIALDGGDDGLVFYRRIAKEAALKKGGLLAFEIGYDQGKEVVDILKECGYTDVEVLPDIEGRDRVVTGRRS